ncbi:MAG: hypothetical protein RR346_04890 [Bacteroidales bacterium]
MNIREKNRAIVRLTADIAHFDTDRELLASITPMHTSITEQTNRFTKPRVHAKIICELLNHVAPEEVFKNRLPKSAPPKEDQQNKPTMVDLVKSEQQDPPKEDQQPEPPSEDEQRDQLKDEQQPEPPADDEQQDPPKEDQQPEPPAPSKKKVNMKSSPE